MRRRLAELIGLRDGEGGRTARLLAFLFLVTLAIVLLKAAQRGIFLAAYSRARIPDAFMVSAGCLAAASLLAAALAPRLGPLRLAQGILGLVVVVLPVGRVLLVAGDPVWAFALYVLVEAISGLLLVQAWQVATEALDVRSAKRLLPLVGVGAGLAWVIGGFAVGALAGVVGAAGLLLVAPALLLGAMLLAHAIGRHDLPRRAPAGARGGLLGGVADGLRHVWLEPLLRLVAVICILDLLVEQVVDFQLFAVAQARWAEPERIAGFMGRLYGASGIVTVLAPLFVSGRLLSRFGSTRCLMVAQVWVLVGSIVFLGLPGLAVIAALGTGDRILKQSLSSPARSQMQTHIAAARRSQASALIRGVLAPLFYLAGGAALKLVPAHGSVRWLSLATVGLAAALLVLTARYMHRAYLAALRRSLDERRLTLDDDEDGSGRGLDREQCDALATELRSPDPARAAFAVGLLAAGDPAVVRPLLHEGCRHPVAEVRAAAVLTLAGLHDAGDVAVLYATLERETADVAEQACLQGLALLEQGAVGDAVRRRTDDADPRVAALARASLARAEAVGFGSLAWAGRALAPAGGLALAGGASAALALAGGEAIVPESRVGELHAMLRSPREAERAAAAWAMGEVRPGHTGLRRAFGQLLDDPAPAVRLAAIRAAGRLGDRPLIARVVAALGDRATAPAAFDALARLEDRDIPAVEAALAGAAPLVVARTAAGLAAGRGGNGDALLLRLLGHDDRVVRYRAARALSARRCAPGWQPPPPAPVRAAVRAELVTGHRYWAIVAAMSDDDGEVAPPLAFLAGELRVRIRQTERRLLALLALVAEPAVIELVGARLRHGDARAAAHAVELLEHALEPALAAQVVPFLEPAPLRRRLQAADAALRADPVGDPLAAILALRDPHLAACAAFAHGARLRALDPAAWKELAPMLPIVERICFLRTVPIFRDLSGEDLRQVAEIAGRVELRAGSVVFRKGEAGDAMFIVARGRITVRDGERALATLGRQELIGELALLDGEPRSADAVCAEDCELLSLARADLEELIERRPEIAREIIRVLSRRLRDANQRGAA